MTAVDTNILVYAHRRDSVWHAPAVEVIRELAEGAEPWMIPWPCVHEFLAVVTHPRVYKPASTMNEATRQVDIWMRSPSLMICGESDTHWSVLCAALRQGKVAGPQVHDARIAALCQSLQVTELLSADRDFSRFAGLIVRNPLVR
ncbi:MAG: type II toxin-antitoxin system VapC family toxin [Phycisphaerae bacterium]